MVPHANTAGEIFQLFDLLAFNHLQIRTDFSFKCESGKEQDKVPVRRSRAPSLAETEEALAQTVWCWAGIAT